MMYPMEINADTVVETAAFLLVLTVWCGGVWLWWMRRRAMAEQVEARLGLGEPDDESARVLRLWHKGREVTTTVRGYHRPTSLVGRLDRLVREAGWDLPLKSILLGIFGTTVLAFLITLVLTDRVIPAVGVTVTVLMCIWAYLRHCINRRISVFERQLIDALELAARSLRAGHPLAGAFRLVAEEIPSPVGEIFGEVSRQQELGVGFAEALQDATARYDNDDLKLFVTSVGIQLRTGGNLADMMDRLVAVMRDRIRLNRRARVLTAQTQLSKRILIVLPFALFALLNLLNPDYMGPLYSTPVGQMLLAGAGLSVLLGVWVMNRMLVLKY